MKLTHSDLVRLGAKWLSKRCSVVVTELTSSAMEEPDVIGFTSYNSWLLECKATRSDFLSDKKKFQRHYSDKGMGNFRYYFTPAGLIKPDELPNDWGLIETDGKKYFPILGFNKDGNINKTHFPFKNHQAEIGLLVSVLRRVGQNAPEGVSIKTYINQERKKATLTIEELK